MERNVYTPEQETWLKALESGEWKQCKGILHGADNTHCCLGVLHRVIPGIGKSEIGEFIDKSSADRMFMHDGDGQLFGQWWDDEYQSLTFANDCGKTFAEIAAFIRANPWQVFTNFDAPTPAADRGER